MNLIVNYIKKLFLIFPNIKEKFYFILFSSLLISLLDLLSFSLVGYTILIFFDPTTKQKIIIFLSDYISFKNFILILSGVTILLFFLKSFFSWIILRNILKFIFSQQIVLRINFLRSKLIFNRVFDINDFKFNLSTVTDYSRALTESTLLSFFKFTADLIIFFIILFFLFYKNFPLTLGLVVFVLITLTLYVKIFKKKLIYFGRTTTELNLELLKISEFIFSTTKDIQAFNKEGVFIKKVKDISLKGTNSSIDYYHLLHLPKYYIEFVLIFFLVSISSFLLNYQGNNYNSFVSIGIFGVAAARLAPIMNTLLVTGSTLINSVHVVNSLYRVFDKVNTSQQVQNNSVKKNLSTLSVDSIKIQNLSFKYLNTHNFIFKNMSVNFSKNNLIGIYGVSGVGKSTLINLILRFLKPTKGAIFFKNKQGLIDELSQSKIVSLISQEISILNESLYKNIALDFKVSNPEKLKIKKILNIVNLNHLVQRLGESDLGHRGNTLSGGQKQKIALSRALFKDSKVLIFDEPFSGIDQDSTLKLIKFLNKIKKDKIIIIITHQIFIKNQFDYIFNLRNQKLILER